MNAQEMMWRDAVKWQVALLRRSGGLSSELLRQFRLVERDMIQIILTSVLDAPASRRYAELRSNMVSVRARVREAFTAYQAAVGAHVLEIATASTRHIAGSFARALDLGDQVRGLAQLTEPQIGRLVNSVEIQGRSLAQWWSRTERGFVDRLGAIGRNAISSNWDRADMMRELRATMKTYRRHLRSMALTSGALAGNSAKTETLQKNGDIVSGLEWVATLDLRTTLICRALHRKQWTLEKVPIRHGFPYPSGGVAHFRERSVTVPFFDDDVIDKLKGEKAASFKGPLPADTSMQKFLESLTPQEQAIVFEPGKLRLWKQGKVSLEDLVTTTGRPVPLSQL